MSNLLGALGEGFDLKHAHRSTPYDGAGIADFFAEELNRLRAYVECHHVRRNGLAFANLSNASARLGLIGYNMINRQQELHAASLRVGQSLLRQLKLVSFQQRLPDLLSLRFEKGIGHASADDQSVNFLHQVLDHADLVANLGTAEDG